LPRRKAAGSGSSSRDWPEINYRFINAVAAVRGGDQVIHKSAFGA
jgi:hypothetical protein